MPKRALAACALWLGLLAGCVTSDVEPGERGDAAAESSVDAGAAAAGAAAPPADTSAGPAPGGEASAGEAQRGPYADLPDMGETRAYFRAHGNRTLVDRGYFRGDLQLAGAGLKKEGAGPGESVIDGHLEVRGDGWVLTGLTITGDLTVRGEGNDVSGCQVLGRVDARGSRNTLP